MATDFKAGSDRPRKGQGPLGKQAPLTEAEEAREKAQELAKRAAATGDEGDGEARVISTGERSDLIKADEPLKQEGMNWFTLRVASNKESSVQATLLRKVKQENMSNRIGRILVPTEKTKTVKNGKQKITETKLYPGYVFVEMRLEPDGRISEEVFFLIKETTGVGDFVGAAGRPSPLADHEIEKMQNDSRKPEELPNIKLVFSKGEAVVIKEGPFATYEGTVDELFPEKGVVRVLVTIFGRQAPIDLEEWMIGKPDKE